mmetsp:Transcript_128780/g.223323  ORF Transcript_128780/g.223323 Transcript_128780/m.223323 type:complete len:251 (+) Transcript_128780:52-804(+)
MAVKKRPAAFVPFKKMVAAASKKSTAKDANSARRAGKGQHTYAESDEHPAFSTPKGKGQGKCTHAQSDEHPAFSAPGAKGKFAVIGVLASCTGSTHHACELGSFGTAKEANAKAEKELATWKLGEGRKMCMMQFQGHVCLDKSGQVKQAAVKEAEQTWMRINSKKVKGLLQIRARVQDSGPAGRGGEDNYGFLVVRQGSSKEAARRFCTRLALCGCHHIDWGMAWDCINPEPSKIENIAQEIRYRDDYGY